MSIQENINRLLWDRRLIVLPKDMEAPEGLDYVVLKDLTLDDRNHYLFIRDLEEHKARMEGVPTEGEIMQKARESGYWTADDEDVDERADEHIAFLEAEFKARAKFKSRQNIIKLQIKDSKAKQDYVNQKRNNLKQQTCEYLAHEIASFMLLRRVALRPDGTPLMPDDSTYLDLKENYLLLVFYLIYEMMGEGALETVEIREIARSTEWRLTWGLARENLPSIFGRTVGDLNINHKMLIYWSRVYDSAFESAEPPDADVIDDDDLFDDWLATRDLERNDSHHNKRTSADHHNEQGHVLDGEYIEKCVCGSKKRNIGKGLGEKTPHAEHCSYGIWRSFSKEEKEERARRVYGRNSTTVRKILDSEQDRVLQKGEIEEQDLRGKKTRSMLGMSTNVTSVKR
jgi:hypothetical protein